jgi:hypothetical protein
VYPERIPVRWVADVLAAIHRLATGETQDEEADETGAAAIRLIGIQRGSAIFRCVAEDGAALIPRLRAVSLGLRDPEKCEVLARALPSVRRLSEIAQSLSSSIVIRDPRNRDDVFARIEPGTYDSISRTLLVTGEKTLTGTVQGVGGATSVRCRLRVTSQPRLVYCDVASDAVARLLGTYLYQQVTVGGMATWVRSSWQILSFDIRTVTQPEVGSLVDAFNALRAAGGDGWDKIADPEGYLEELSGQR